MTSDRHFDMLKGNLVEFYLKKSYREQISKLRKKSSTFHCEVFKINLTYIFETSKLQLKKRKKLSVN